ncbi:MULTISPECIES: hypothetical protein [Alteromonadaceae]|uniref:hypothetical protein n=1 Tax=Alteromonadaceae TaxID=72275 RepID=UPI001C0A56F6|nr:MULTISPECIES: hypothetical protein [Aliiglaciecola]MBU2879556.1 hypothetical protein [Aliiglaciecola lipolytica]MDO6712525.1 hypothetical protein [Aliiglaciecola sp. 2_MG-2023]MDO6753731.1 hypothetical protein [Aliiglaciecola sp. 1_MG-2023]
MQLKKCIVNICIILCVSFVQSATLFAQVSSQPEPQRRVEQIEVVGTKPLYFYRQQMVKTELEFYDYYNDLVDNPKFKVKCKRERKQGAGRITQRACYPQYFLAKKTQLTEIAMRASAALPSDDDVAMQVQQEKQASLAYAEKLIEREPALKKRLIEMYQAKKVFFSKQQSVKDKQ